jgi:radical SAM-linked protein
VRVRIRFTKLGKIRFTSHRDVARIWERVLRRAALPIALTEGFSPRPKMHFGLALSTGHESWGEYLDVDLREPEGAQIDVATLPELLSPLLPVGMDVEAAAVIERSLPSLQEAVTACRWRIEVPGLAVAERQAAVEKVLAAAELPVSRERKGKTVVDDIRPAILELVLGADGVLETELATQPRGVRPQELVNAIANVLASGPEVAALDEGHVCRTHQWIVLDGAQREPLPRDATRAPHVQARAS